MWGNGKGQGGGFRQGGGYGRGGFGRGYGYRRGYGFGRGRMGYGRGFGSGFTGAPGPYAPPSTPEEELQMLLDYKAYLEEQLKAVEDRIRQLQDMIGR